MNAILISRNGSPSMRRVTAKLNDVGVRVSLLRRRDNIWDIAPTEPIDTLVRWGSTARSGGATKTYNPARGIHAASNKAEARLALQEAGVPVPRTAWLSMAMVDSWQYPVVVRPRNHQGGNDFHLLNSHDEVYRWCRAHPGWESDHYVSEFYPKQREYRVHVASGMVLIVNEKVPRAGEEDKREEPIWNQHTNNFYFRVLLWRNWPLHVIKPAIRAVRFLGLDFAGVDVMADAPGDHPPAVICELNTAPSINEDYSSTKYAAYFKWLLQENREWANIDSTHPPDFAFRGEL